MKLFKLSFLLLFITSISLNAQSDETLFNKLNFRLTGAWGGPLSGISKVGDDYSPHSGGYGLLEFDKRILLGWGGATLSDRVDFKGESANYSLDYNGFMIGYTPQAFRVIHPRALFMVGSSRIQKDNLRDNSPFVQLSGGAEVNIFRWFRVSANAGYRALLDVDGLDAGLSASDFSGLFGELSFKFGWSWGRS